MPYNRKIDFLVAGAQKSGTTALDWYLRMHQDIGMPCNKKEIHFFDNEDFSFCIKNEQNRTKVAAPYQHRRYSYIDRGFYAEQITRFKQFFSIDQMLFIKYETYKNNPESELLKIFDFLELDANRFEYQPVIANKREIHGILTSDDKHYLLEELMNDIRKVEKELNWDCSDWFEL